MSIIFICIVAVVLGTRTLLRMTNIKSDYDQWVDDEAQEAYCKKLYEKRLKR